MATTKVQVYVYDLSNGMMAAMSEPLLGKKLEGLWHTAVVAYGAWLSPAHACPAAHVSFYAHHTTTSAVKRNNPTPCLCAAAAAAAAAVPAPPRRASKAPNTSTAEAFSDAAQAAQRRGRRTGSWRWAPQVLLWQHATVCDWDCGLSLGH